MKKILTLLFFSLLMVVTACANEGKDVSTDISDEKVVIEELSPLEGISKVCLESTMNDCGEIFIELGHKVDEEFPKEILDKYIYMLKVMLSEEDITRKQAVISQNMGYLSSKGYPNIIKDNSDSGNLNFVKLIEDKIYPLAQVYNSKQINIGMSNLELIISLGYPNKINTTTTSSNVSQQWIYRNDDIYVYLDNGVVTSYQN